MIYANKLLSDRTLTVFKKKEPLGLFSSAWLQHFALIIDSLSQYPPSKMESGSFFAGNQRT